MMLRYVIAFALGALLSQAAGAREAPTPERVARSLTEAFASARPSQIPQTEVVEKEYVGIRTRTVTFSLGKKVYRIVFSSDDTVSVALTTPGAISATPLWDRKLSETSLEDLVNLVYAREFGKVYVSPYGRKETKPVEEDQESKIVRSAAPSSGNAVGWNQLMNQVLKGDVGGLAKSGGGNPDRGLSQAAALGRMLDPCAQGQGSGSAQRSTVTDLAEAMVKAGMGRPSASELLAERSRKFRVTGTYSFTRDLDQYADRQNTEEVFNLIQQSGSDAYELFRAALRNTEVDAKDPYALAALRNFKSVARGMDEQAGKKLVDGVLGRVAVDVEAFTRLSQSTPKTLVIYDRITNRFYVDPTLTTPAQARYLLSVAALYESALKKRETQMALSQYTEMRKQIALVEHAVIDTNDERSLARRRTQAQALAQKLFELSDRFRQLPSQPSL